MTGVPHSYTAEVSNVAEQLRIWSESGSRPDEWLLREWAQRLKVVSDGLDGPNELQPWTAEAKARLDVALFGKSNHPLAWIRADGLLIGTKEEADKTVGYKVYPLYAKPGKGAFPDDRDFEDAGPR